MIVNEDNSLKASNGNSFWNFFIGLVMIIMGIYVIINPGISMLALALYIGIAMLISGFAYIVASFSYISGWYIFAGILNLLIGVILVGNLGITAASIPIVFALWAMFLGAVQLAGAYQLKHLGLNWKWSLLYGILGVAFGFLILLCPVIGKITISMMIGMYIISFGLLSVSEYSCCRIKR